MIRNNKNYGFAVACNQGADLSSSDHILFLNPDVRLASNSLNIAVSYISHSRNHDVGIVGIQLLDKDDNIQRSCARFPGSLSMAATIIGLDHINPGLFHPHFLLEWDHKDTRQVDQVMGAFFLVRRTLYKKLGGFDERFFIYYEDLDFSLRAVKHGCKSVYLADTQAYHSGGGSSGQIPALRLFYVLRSRTLYCLKHFGLLNTLGLLFLTLFVEPLSRVFNTCVRRDTGQIKYIISAYIRFIVSIANMHYVRK